ncbi:deoxyribodipyrimidine photolyase-related protein [Terracoccus luteus]|uniref:Deoxyribodipyrimidine photolyase-related protein n=1 Tax=Terracoccus luteus TaxID=53356 RepID=A0A495XVB3_9MICO|nr:cryptochrome/photolyase family protein [Terracoccus luteus]RKT78511.1 deoxyribodipyrimidine photolyase-related protein [Terracoccus luteus]
MTRRWLFADQLGPHFDVGRSGVLLVESRSALGRRRYHRQKLHLILSALRHRAADLGDSAVYLRADTYGEALAELGEPVRVYEPTSFAADAFVRRRLESGEVESVDPTPGYSLRKDEFATWAGDRRRLRMDDFYRFQRLRLDLLMEGADPVGGRWSYDDENREPPPKGRATLGAPAPYRPREDDIDAEVRDDLDRWERDEGLETVGADGPRLFAVTRREALAALERFVTERLAGFGPHEDAMLKGDWEMAHSLLSVPLNLGLLSPVEVAERAVQAHADGDAPLASVEGFVRQVVGWREYVWHVYWHFGRTYRRRNTMAARTSLPPWFDDLEADSVDAACLGDVLGGVRDRGWVHHIPRLMVLGNWAAQRGYDPDELTEWFQTRFVDGYDWVMPANVVGMSQHADGGAMATKPYVSGGAYIDRMSDYCGGCRYDPKKRVGEDACPFTAGYWAYLDRNADRLEGNNRMARPLQGRHRLKDLHEVVEQEKARGDDPP